MDSLSPSLEPCYRAKTIIYPDGGVETVAYNPRSMCRGNPFFVRTKTVPRTDEEIAEAERKRQDSAERARRRAAKNVRVTARYLQLDRMVTLSTRELETDYDTLVEDWDRVRRLLSKEFPGFVYVAVPEPHPTRPGHYHIHIGVRGWKDANVLRRMWHRVLRRRGRLDHLGEKSPGGVNIKRRSYAPQRMARYLSKYFAKSWEIAERFGRKRYWSGRLDESQRPVWFRWTPAARNVEELERELYDDPTLVIEGRHNPVPGVWWISAAARGSPPGEGIKG